MTDKRTLLTAVMLLAATLCVSAQSGKYSESGTGRKLLAKTTVKDPSTKKIFTDRQFDKKNLFVVISKQDRYPSLRVYAKSGADTLIVAEYPVCLSKLKGQKQKKGDMKTPESWPGKPFTISQIQDASTWRHDFHDGRGNQLAYGHWFLRLVTPGHSGIGIHGSTGNEWSIPGSQMQKPSADRTVGRDSEGCIRLNDLDIIHFKENYAYIGMPITIKPEGMDLLPFEQKALAAAEGEGAQRNNPKPAAPVAVQTPAAAAPSSMTPAPEPTETPIPGQVTPNKYAKQQMAVNRMYHFVLITNNEREAFDSEGHFNKEKFVRIAPNKTEIEIQSDKKPELLSDSPQNSYEIKKVAKGEYLLKILNPETFWADGNNYQIILTK
ncbi:MAG: L,D-transpeptidase [Bacteroidaceae bacterium]|nr:L,D-transpeptidase [Bacteroidaceae bacterium]